MKDVHRHSTLVGVMVRAAEAIAKYAPKGKRRRFRDDLFNCLRLQELMRPYRNPSLAPEDVRDEMRRLISIIRTKIVFSTQDSHGCSDPIPSCPRNFDRRFYDWIKLQILMSRYPRSYDCPDEIRDEMRRLYRLESPKQHQQSDFFHWKTSSSARTDPKYSSLNFLEGFFPRPNDNPALAGIPGETVVVFPKDINAILALKAVENEIIEMYERRIWQAIHSLRSQWTVVGSVIDEGDLYQMGVLAFRDAMYSYNRTDVQFLTYSYRAVSRRMLEEIGRSHDVRARGNRHEKLLRAFYRLRLRKPQFSTEDLIESLEIRDNVDDDPRPITEREKNMLRRFLQHFVRQDQMVTRDDDGEESDLLSQVSDPLSELDIDSISFEDDLEEAGLTSMERELIMAAMEQRWGSQTEIVSRYINPKTGNPYTKTTAKNSLITAKAKIDRVRERRLSVGKLMSEYSWSSW